MTIREMPRIAFTTLALSALVTAEEIPDAWDTLAPLEIIGSQERVYDLAGAAAYLDAEDWRAQGYNNINRILGRVPGVYVREEDGFGNFPNISMRGADGTRSEKVTLMEDGILAAPAPYSAPSAYYSPRASRMAGLEILKGSSQIKYGPQTTAGVLNYLSTAIPSPGENSFYWRSTYGSDNTYFNHAYYGNVIEVRNGRFGYLFEILRESSDGFRDLDGGGDTGFEVTEPMVKLFWEPDTALEQRFEFKYGHTDLDADETYVGLSEMDFAANPYRRYAGTQFDNMQTQQNRTYLKWIAKPTENFSMETAAYYNDFARNWYKIRGVDVNTDTALLNGSAAGEISLRANARSYESYGIQFTGLYEFNTGAIEHDLGFGARWHSDEVRRFQRDDTITSAGTGPGGFTISNFGAPGDGGNRLQSAEAISFWVSDEIDFGKLTLSPGFRYEDISLDNTDFEDDPPSNTPTAVRSGNESYFAPGIGFTYDINDCNRLFGGVFKGYSIAGPRSILKDGVEKEESLGYELGLRHRDGAVNAELVAFLTDFDNLIGTDAGNPDPNNQNVGEAEVYGVEGFLGYDAGADRGYSFGIPMYLSATWTVAELRSTVTAGGGDNIYAGGVDGSEIPYVPEWKLAAGIGLAFEKWGTNLDVTYTSSTFGTANNFNMPMTNQRQGKIDEAFLVDLSAYYRVTEDLKLVGGIQNLLDEDILVSRSPLGARAGAPRSLYGGFEWTF